MACMCWTGTSICCKQTNKQTNVIVGHCVPLAAFRLFLKGWGLVEGMNFHVLMFKACPTFTCSVCKYTTLHTHQLVPAGVPVEFRGPWHFLYAVFNSPWPYIMKEVTYVNEVLATTFLSSLHSHTYCSHNFVDLENYVDCYFSMTSQGNCIHTTLFTY